MAQRKKLLAFLSLGLLAMSAAALSNDSLEPAKEAIRVKEFDHAASLLLKHANSGDAAAQYLLGTLLLSELTGTERDSIKQAEKWFERAASKESRAALMMAWLEASRVPSDASKAQHWLKQAAQLGNPQALELLQANALPMNSPTADLSDAEARRDMLWLAASRSDVNFLSVIADKYSINVVDEFGRGALHRAAQSGATASIQWLLSHGAKVTADQFGVTPIMLASTVDSAESLRLFIHFKADITARDQLGNTALMYAARHAKYANADVLVAAGIDINARNLSGWSALEFAEQAAASNLANSLRSKGLVSRRNSTGAGSVELMNINSVLRAPAKQTDLYAGWTDMAVLVSRDRAQFTASAASAAQAHESHESHESLLMIAVNSNAPASITSLLSANVDPTQADSQGSTPLVVAARRCHRRVLRALLDGGVNPDTHSEKEDYPLIAAVRAGRLDCVSELLLSNADVNAVDRKGNSALIIAAQLGNREILSLLLKFNPDINRLNLDNSSALSQAVKTGGETVQLLISARAKLDMADNDGMTPLLIAAAHGDTGTVEMLLTAGANPLSRNSRRETALLLAAAGGNANIVAQLLKTPVEINAQSHNGETALIAASRVGHGDVVQLLLDAGASSKLRNIEKASALDVAKNLGFTKIALQLERG